jgi:hypothetical protein
MYVDENSPGVRHMTSMSRCRVRSTCRCRQKARLCIHSNVETAEIRMKMKRLMWLRFLLLFIVGDAAGPTFAHRTQVTMERALGISYWTTPLMSDRQVSAKQDQPVELPAAGYCRNSNISGCH